MIVTACKLVRTAPAVHVDIRGRGRTGCQEEAMVSLKGVGCKQYRERVGGRTAVLPAVSCPAYV